MSPVRIDFCITDLDPGGAERALWQLVSRLDRRLWDPRVICLGPRGEIVDWFDRAGIPVVCLGMTRRSQFPVGLWRLCRLLRESLPALLQTFLFHANFIGRFAARIAGIPVVVSGIRVAERRSNGYLLLDRWTDPLVQRHLCVSPEVAEFSATVGGLPRRKLAVIPNGVDLQAADSATPMDWRQLGIESAGEPILLGVGRLDAQKGWDLLLQALPAVWRECRDTRLVLAGRGSEESALKALAAQVDPQGDRIHFAGYQPQILRLMKGSTALILASRWEGLPNVVLEAMSCRLPVVATQVEGIAALIPDERFGLTVPTACPGALAEAILKTLRDPVAARQRAETARLNLAGAWTWERQAARLSTLYQQLLNQTRDEE